MGTQSKKKLTKKQLKNTTKALQEATILSVSLYSFITYLRDMEVLTDTQFIPDLKGCDLTKFSKDIQYVILQARKVTGALKYMDDLYKQIGLKEGDKLLASIEKEKGLPEFGLAYSNYVFGICLLNHYLEFFEKPNFVINVKLSESVEAYDLVLDKAFKSEPIVLENLMEDSVLAQYFYDRAMCIKEMKPINEHKRFKQRRAEKNEISSKN